MNLTFQTRYKSIRELANTELPSFVLLTGVNGTGKTHLLRAIEAGSIAVDVVKDPKVDVRYFDWSNLVPNDATQVATNGLYQERDQILQQITHIKSTLDPAMSHVLAQPALRKWRFDGWQLARLPDSEFINEFGDTSESKALRQQLRNLVKQASSSVIASLGQNHAAASRLRSVAAENHIEPALLEYKHFSGKHIGWGSVDIFQQSFAQLFLAYFEQQKLNRLYKMDVADERQPPELPLTDEQFLEKHGEPPWNFVNRVLADAGLDFEIDRPEGWAQTVYWPQLTKRSAGVVVPFSALSSGEKILMSFALCLYNSTDRRQQVVRPKLLLLDEVDAPLHPSMCRRLMTTVTRTLVEREKINVVMTTHSPSTVAVAPEGSVFVLDHDRSGVRKATKAEALSILTSDIPMLSISFDGRRQVFVESDTDAELYQLLYQGLRSSLASERSLVFIGAGRRPASGADENAGCDQVKRVVSQLAAGGNSSVFGLIDWDRKRTADGRIAVLAPGERYSIENCLLDPLLLAAVAIREDRAESGLLKADEAFVSLQGMSIERLQQLAETVQRRVLEKAGQLPGDSRDVKYVGNFSLRLAEGYLHMNGHKLEATAKEVFPRLLRFHRPTDLLRHVINNIVTDVPRLMPRVLAESFRDLLTRESQS